MNTEPLREAVKNRKALETAIEEIAAPIKAVLADALGGLPDVLRAAKANEAAAREAFEAAFLAAWAERGAALEAGIDAPPIVTPGLGITWREVVAVDAPADLPREYLTPDTKQIEAALKAGATVPGARLVHVPSFRVL